MEIFDAILVLLPTIRQRFFGNLIFSEIMISLGLNTVGNVKDKISSQLNKIKTKV